MLNKTESGNYSVGELGKHVQYQVFVCVFLCFLDQLS